jgi:hypothetical protein
MPVMYPEPERDSARGAGRDSKGPKTKKLFNKRKDPHKIKK